jgi:thioredoxin
MALLILLLGIASIKKMPAEIFPEIDIPVVSVVWQYPRLSMVYIRDVPHVRDGFAVQTNVVRQDGFSDSNVPILVDFSATCCGPCRMIAPMLDEIAEEQAEAVRIVKVDVDNNPELSNRFGIQNIPTL